MKKKHVLFIILLVLVVGGFFLYKKESQSSQNSYSTGIGSSKFYLKVQGEKNFAVHDGYDGESALHFLQKNETVIAKGQGENAFVTSINGRMANESQKEYWAFYVNGKPSEVGAGSYQLKDGDKIEWKIEKY